MLRSTVLVALAISLSVPAAAQGQVPRDLRDLVGTGASSGENELQSRGWVHIKTETGDDRKWSYWWQPGQRSCVSIAVVGGRFDAITPTTAPDCNQRAGEKGSSASAVAAGVGIAALVGAIALAHKSHNHDNGKHYGDEAAEGVFDRGYRDGLYNQTYHNYGRSEPYSRGYESGVAQRSRETSHRDGHRPSGAGYQPSVDLNDLVDARGSSADGEMQRRGFRNVGALKSGTSSYTYWFNARTRQCVQMGVADGRVQNVQDIGTYQGCR